MDELQRKEKLIISASRKNSVRAGDTWSINDSKTRGHKSSITKRKGDEVEHIPRTHSPKTRGGRNIKLQENPQKGDARKAYVVPKVQVSKVKDLGKKHNEPIKNAVDKSVIRHIKKQHKKKK